MERQCTIKIIPDAKDKTQVDTGGVSDFEIINSLKQLMHIFSSKIVLKAEEELFDVSDKYYNIRNRIDLAEYLEVLEELDTIKRK